MPRLTNIILIGAGVALALLLVGAMFLMLWPDKRPQFSFKVRLIDVAYGVCLLAVVGALIWGVHFGLQRMSQRKLDTAMHLCLDSAQNDPAKQGADNGAGWCNAHIGDYLSTPAVDQPKGSL